MVLDVCRLKNDSHSDRPSVINLAVPACGSHDTSFLSPLTAASVDTFVYPVPTSTVEINPNWEVLYSNTSVYGVVTNSVVLKCGTTLPDLYIWSFTQPGTEAIKAVVYNLGRGPKIQKIAKTLGQLTIVLNSADVSIDKLLLAANGLFTCQAFYNIDEDPKVHYYYVHLTVQVPVSKPILLMTGTPVEGSKLWMYCNVTNGTGPIQYVWQHETQNKNITNLNQNNSVVHVDEVNRNYTGWYRCVVSNAVNNESSDQVWLDIKFGPDDAHIDVSLNTISEWRYTALETKNVSLVCQAQSNPPSQYLWFYNNFQINTGPQLSITKILRNDTGNYTCFAQNTHLNTSSNRTISLMVYCECDHTENPFLEWKIS
uniref:Ig-like domain-containing protein n=1 Tax=Oryzias latipes TaxID=8090 RepID=A0A3B3I4T0_ORYLA